MSLIINTTEIPSGGVITYNGNEVKEVYYNGVRVWQKVQYYKWVLGVSISDVGIDDHCFDQRISAYLYPTDSSGNNIGSAMASYSMRLRLPRGNEDRYYPYICTPTPNATISNYIDPDGYKDSGWILGKTLGDAASPFSIIVCAGMYAEWTYLQPMHNPIYYASDSSNKSGRVGSTISPYPRNGKYYMGNANVVYADEKTATLTFRFTSPI